MARLYHVTSSHNRNSILAHGLDWNFMGAAVGIAGSTVHEQAGCFLCQDEDEVSWFLSLNNTGGPLDVWAVYGVPEEALLISPEGYHYLPEIIRPGSVELVDRDIEPHGFPPSPWPRQLSGDDLDGRSE